MVVLARPVVGAPGLVRRAAGEHTIDHFLQRKVPQRALEADPFLDQGGYALGGASILQPSGADAWLLSSDSDPSFPYQSRLELRMDGAATYWYSPTIHSVARDDHDPILLEGPVTRAAHQLLATVAWIYERAGYVGMVDVAIAVLDIERAIAGTLAQSYDPGPAYGAPDYRRHARVAMTELTSDMESVVRPLVMPLFEAISVRDYDPYAQARDRTP